MDVPDLNVASVQLLLRTRKLTTRLPVDGVYDKDQMAHVFARVLRRYDWTTTPSAERLLEWIRAQPPEHVEVPRIRTPCHGELLRGVLWMGHLRALGRPASDDRLRMATVHLEFVHGADLRDCWTWNLGNWPAEDGYVGAWCRAPGGDRRAYAEPLEGAEAHWACLAEQKPAFLDAFDAGDEGEVRSACTR